MNGVRSLAFTQPNPRFAETEPAGDWLLRTARTATKPFLAMNACSER
jgi:hypothetical protein